MDKFERLNFINQMLILEKLYPEEAEYYAKNRKALEHGYELHYSWLVESISDPLSEDQCKQVLDVLDMYRSITFSWERLHGGEEIPSKLKFRGFDGNNETAQMGYTQYFINDLDRFRELTYDSDYCDFNSHCPMLEKYTRMLAMWKSLDSFELSEEEIEAVVAA